MRPACVTRAILQLVGFRQMAAHVRERHRELPAFSRCLAALEAQEPALYEAMLVQVERAIEARNTAAIKQALRLANAYRLNCPEIGALQQALQAGAIVALARLVARLVSDQPVVVEARAFARTPPPPPMPGRVQSTPNSPRAPDLSRTHYRAATSP